MKISCNAMHPEYAKPCTLIPHAEGLHQAYVGGVGLVSWGGVAGGGAPAKAGMSEFEVAAFTAASIGAEWIEEGAYSALTVRHRGTRMRLVEVCANAPLAEFRKALNDALPAMNAIYAERFSSAP